MSEPSNATSHRRALALRFSHVALPDCAVDCEPWEWNDTHWTRLFTVREWKVGAVLVAVFGEQTHTGAVAYYMYVGGEDQLSASARMGLTKAFEDAGRLIDSLG